MNLFRYNLSTFRAWQRQRCQGSKADYLKLIPIAYPDMKTGLPLIVGHNPSENKKKIKNGKRVNFGWKNFTKGKSLATAAKETACIHKEDKEGQGTRKLLYFSRFEDLLGLTEKCYNHVDLFPGNKTDSKKLFTKNKRNRFENAQIRRTLRLICDLKPSYIVVSSLEAGKIIREELKIDKTEVMLHVRKKFGRRTQTTIFFLPFLGHGLDHHSQELWRQYIEKTQK